MSTTMEKPQARTTVEEPQRSGAATDADTEQTPDAGIEQAPEARSDAARDARTGETRDTRSDQTRDARNGETRDAQTENADSMAVASFVMGLVGLLAFNLVLGPCALVLGGLALARNTTRRGRALFGTALGAADLIVLAVTVTASGTVSWNFAG